MVSRETGASNATSAKIRPKSEKQDLRIQFFSFFNAMSINIVRFCLFLTQSARIHQAASLSSPHAIFLAFICTGSANSSANIQVFEVNLG